MSNVNIGFQVAIQVGNRVIFDEDGGTGPRDLGVIRDAMNPEVTNEVAELMDPYPGNLRTIAESTNRQDLVWNLKTGNANLDNLAMQLMSRAPEAWSQSGTPVTDSRLTGKVGHLIAVLDKSTVRERVYDVATFDAITIDPDGVPAAAAAGDFDTSADLLRRGYVKLLAGGPAGLVEGADVVIDLDYTANEKTGNRLIAPMSADTKRGYFEVFVAAEEGEYEAVNRFYGSWRSTNPEFSVEDYSSLNGQLRVLRDENNPDYPYGTWKHFRGDLPSSAA